MRDTRPKNKEELTASIKDIWASITPRQCHRLIASMPRRIEAVIKAKGFPTKYWRLTYRFESAIFWFWCDPNFFSFFLQVNCDFFTVFYVLKSCILIFWNPVFVGFVSWKPKLCKNKQMNTWNSLNCGPWIYNLWKFNFLNGILEINQLFHDILIFWKGSVYLPFNNTNQ